MKKTLIIFIFVMCSLISFAQNWNVTFHPGDKLPGLPDRYACEYEDPNYTLQLRSDIPYIKVITKEKAFEGCNDTIKVELFNTAGTYIRDTVFVNGDFYEGNILVMRCWQGVNWLMKGGRIRITINNGSKTIILRVNNMDSRGMIAQYHEYLDCIKEYKNI